MEPSELLSRLTEGETLFAGIILEQVDLTRVNLKRCDLVKSQWTGVNLRGADLSQANFREAVLTDVNLRGSHLFAVNFARAG